MTAYSREWAAKGFPGHYDPTAHKLAVPSTPTTTSSTIILQLRVDVTIVVEQLVERVE